MIDRKEYLREYMQKYRNEIKNNPDKLKKRREYAKKYRKEILRNDPEWVEKERRRNRESMRKKRENPEFRDLQYKRHREWAKRNKDYVNKKQRERNKRDSNKIKARTRTLKKYYGLTLEEYQDKVKNQCNKCAICEEIFDIGRVDHDHATNKTRDLLCNRCNLNLGFVETHKEIVKSMLAYLSKWE